MFALLLYVNISHLICACHTLDQFEVLTLGAGYPPPPPKQKKKKKEDLWVTQVSTICDKD